MPHINHANTLPSRIVLTVFIVWIKKRGMAKPKGNNRGKYRTDRNGVVRSGATIFISLDKEEKAMAMRGKFNAPDGSVCFSLKSVYEAIIEKALK